MTLLDQLNAKDGEDSLFRWTGNPATVADEEEMLSPRYTTRFSDLLVVR
jgi:DNA polymerase V